MTNVYDDGVGPDLTIFALVQTLAAKLEFEKKVRDTLITINTFFMFILGKLRLKLSIDYISYDPD